MSSSTKLSIKLTKVLIWIDAGIWLIMGILIMSELHPAIPEGNFYRWGMGGLSLLAVVYLLVIYRLTVDRGGFAYYALLVGLTGIILLTVTDQFGVIDLMVLLAHLVPLILLIMDYRDYPLKVQDSAYVEGE